MYKIVNRIVILCFSCIISIGFAYADNHDLFQVEIDPGTQALMDDGETQQSIKRILSRSVIGLGIDGHKFKVNWSCKGRYYYTLIRKKDAEDAIESSRSYKEIDDQGNAIILTWDDPIATRIFYDGGKPDNNIDPFIATWTYDENDLIIHYVCDGINQVVGIPLGMVSSLMSHPKGYEEPEKTLLLGIK